MKIRTQELIGPALDWAVAQSEGLPLKLDPMGFREHYPDSIEAGWWVWYGANQGLVVGHRTLHRGRDQGYSPSTDWAQGGPIIEREELHWGFGGMRDGKRNCLGLKRGYWQKPTLGPTPLIATMRCYVIFKLGDEVEVPDELLGDNHEV